MTQVEIAVLVVGIVSAFAMGMIAIRFLMGYIKQNDFTVFGVYRIFIGLVVLELLVPRPLVFLGVEWYP